MCVWYCTTACGPSKMWHSRVCIQGPGTKTVVHTTEKIKQNEGGKERVIKPERQRQLSKVAQVSSCLYLR